MGRQRISSETSTAARVSRLEESWAPPVKLNLQMFAWVDQEGGDEEEDEIKADWTEFLMVDVTAVGGSEWSWSAVSPMSEGEA